MNTREGERIMSRQKRGLREKKTKIHSEDLINIKKYKNGYGYLNYFSWVSNSLLEVVQLAIFQFNYFL